MTTTKTSSTIFPSKTRDSTAPTIEAPHWFVFSEERVLGPFSEEDVQFNLSQDRWTEPLIWGRGQNEWLPPPQWQKRQEDWHLMREKELQTSEYLWKVKVGNQELQPMKYGLMMEFLKSRTDLGEIFLWPREATSWKEVFQVSKVTEELGVSRRSHPRVPMMGTLICEAGGKTFTAKVQSISEGGLGMSEAPATKIGEKFKVLIKSPNLFTPIHANIEIVYSGNDSYVGARFVNLQSESRSAIIEYVKKYNTASSASNPSTNPNSQTAPLDSPIERTEEKAIETDEGGTHPEIPPSQSSKDFKDSE